MPSGARPAAAGPPPNPPALPRSTGLSAEARRSRAGRGPGTPPSTEPGKRSGAALGPARQGHRPAGPGLPEHCAPKEGARDPGNPFHRQGTRRESPAGALAGRGCCAPTAAEQRSPSSPRRSPRAQPTCRRPERSRVKCVPATRDTLGWTGAGNLGRRGLLGGVRVPQQRRSEAVADQG